MKEKRKEMDVQGVGMWGGCVCAGNPPPVMSLLSTLTIFAC